MKKTFKIWTEECKEDPSDKYCYLRLDQTKKPGGIGLMACDAKGIALERGAILVLDSQIEVIVTFDCISHDIPLKTDITDTVLVYTEREAEELLRPIFPLNMVDIQENLSQHFGEGSHDHPKKERTVN